MADAAVGSMPVRLYLFIVGKVPGKSTPYPTYLIQTQDGANILIDTGFPPEDYGSAGPLAPDDQIVHQLGKLGLAPSDIDILICSHLDSDHAGCNDAFPDAEIVIQREHYEWAQTAKRTAGFRAHWDQPNLHYRLIDGDTELRPGIRLIETSGHVPGHQSVLLQLPKTGTVLLAIDAIASAAYSDPETRTKTPFDMDEAGVRASTKKLADLIEREGIQMVIYGHDVNQWATLKLAPQFYE